jgi:ABC-type molybdate transport system substrate-binding protein
MSGLTVSTLGAVGKLAMWNGMQAARTLLTFLRSPEAVELFKARGFEPASR